MLKSLSQTKEKHDSLVLSRSDLWMVWRWHGISRVHCYYFCLEPTVTKDTWMRTTSVTVMVIFFKSGILKVTGSQLCSNSFATITRHIDNCVLKDTLQFGILRTWINICVKSFIKTSINVTETKIDESAWKKISCAKIQACTWRALY